MPKSIAQYKIDLSKSRESIFSSSQGSILEAVHAFTDEVDAVLLDIYASLIPEEMAEQKICLVALGGYGRRELCPYSDVDVLVLHEEGHAEEAIAAMVRRFWDVGLNMGCVVRTPASCAAIMGDDFATDTALLESRYLAGDRHLYDRLNDEVIRPYFGRQKKNYLEEIIRILRNSLYSQERSIYRVEPDLKDGTCCLRDCQRILWAERVRNGAESFPDLHLKARFTAAQAARLEKDYIFLLRLRAALHQVCHRRLDVLETALQPAVAEACGFGVNGAGRMMEQFFRAVRRIRLVLLSFLERDLSGRNIWRDIRKRISAQPIAPGIAVLDGIFFSSRSDDPHIGSPLWLMDVFAQTVIHRSTLSVELRNRLRHFAAHMPSRDFRSQAIGTAFRGILNAPSPIGQTLHLMHETRVLEKLMPQFESLTCKVEYDSYHEYTIDQHILLALKTADEMATEPDEAIRGIYKNLKRPFLLRLALLLHDIGKSGEGDHSLSGAVIAEDVCERLGLNGEETGRIRFLVQHHLDMSYLSLQREPEDHSIRQFAHIVEDLENLDMLYLLTVADIRSVGPRTWTQWKAIQLEYLYGRTKNVLDQDGEDPAGKTSASDPEDRYSIPIEDEAYYQSTTPSERRRHVQWLAAVDVADILLYNEPFSGFEQLTVCGHDRIGFLNQVIGCLTAEGYNILSARLYSTTDKKALDIFHIEPPLLPRLTPPVRIENIYKKWRRLVAKETTPDDLVRERLAKYPPVPLRQASSQPSVRIHFDNAASPLFTLVEIDTPDNFGLLHKIARCFSDNGINIASARLSTRSDLAVDVFYINDINKGKIIEKKQIARLRRKLLKVVGG